MTEKTQKFISFTLGVLAMSILLSYLVFAWNEPSQNPPQGNVAPPLNTSINAQAKEGTLVVGNNSAVTTGLIVRYGNVGIGTTSPAGQLDVSGSFYTRTGEILLRPQNTTYEGGQITFYGAGSYDTWFHDVWQNSMRFFTNSANTNQVQMFNVGTGSVGLYVQGNVGIGTTAPGIAKLNVANQGTNVGIYVGNVNTQPYGQAMIEINPPGAATHIWAQEGETRVFSVTAGGTGYFAGNVGIGTTAPSKKLDVNGSIKTSGRIGTQGYDPDSGYPSGWGGGIHTWDVYAHGSVRADGYLCIRNDCRDAWPSGGGYWAANGNHIYNTNSGNVGIGTTAPSEKLHVAGTIRIEGWDAVLHSVDTAGRYQDLIGTYQGWNPNTVYIAGYNAVNNPSGRNTTAVSIGGSGSERLWVNLTTGNVGIGTTAPAGQLDVASSFYTAQGTIIVRPQGWWYEGGEIQLIDPWGSNSWNIDNYQGRIRFHRGGTEYMTIVPNGNVGIGTSNPTTRAVVDIEGNSQRAALYWGPGGAYSAQGFLGYGSKAEYPGTNADNVLIGAVATTGANLMFRTGDRTRMIITNDGNVGIGDIAPYAPSYRLQVSGIVAANAFYNLSDIRLKENISEIKDALEKILRLQGVTFTWKESGEKSIGLIAQEVEKMFPELVKTDNSGIKSIDYGRLTSVLIEGIKEQQKEIDSLRQEIENLKNQLKR
jgi:hypothetical protein